MKKALISIFFCAQLVFLIRPNFLLASDFINNFNGTITDNETSLIWQQDPTHDTWENALVYCENLYLGGWSDWRLPNIRELESIMDENRAYPAINTEYFPDYSDESFWSSTTDDGISSFAWCVSLSVGRVYSDFKSNYYIDYSRYFRCVRGGEND